jgi:hypothetical protein
MDSRDVFPGIIVIYTVPLLGRLLDTTTLSLSEKWLSNYLWAI